MTDWLNFHHLRYFWVVAHEGSLRLAAEKMNVSPPLHLGSNHRTRK